MAASKDEKPVQRRLTIRFNNPADPDWLAAETERRGLDVIGPTATAAATVARMLIRAARLAQERGEDPLALLEGKRPQSAQARRVAPQMEIADELEPEGEPLPPEEGVDIDIDAIVDSVAAETEPAPRDDDREALPEGAVRVFGQRRQRSAVDWRR